MKFVFAFNGTRGDIQPAVVIAAEMQRRGHDVVFGVPPNLFDFAARLGLDARPFGYDTRAHMNSELVRHGLRTGSPAQRLQAFREIRDLGWTQLVDEMRDLHRGADAIVTGFTTEQIAFAFAEATGVPFATVHHAPITANGAVSPIPGAPASLPGWLNRTSWSVVDHAFWQLTRGRENRLRADLDLAQAHSPLPERIAAYGAVRIQAYDAAFVPELAAEWGADRPFVGFVDLDPDQRRRIGVDTALDRESARWIADGTPPIYFGFGSMPVEDPARLVADVAAVCAELGERALFSAGWNDFSYNDVEASTHVRLVGPVDHHQVFPMCKALVHHGGAGTTATGLRAGRAALICSVGSDQPFWGAQLTGLGIGAATSLKDLDRARLRTGLTTVLADDYRSRATEFASRLVESGAAVDAAADLIEAKALRRAGEAQ